MFFSNVTAGIRKTLKCSDILEARTDPGSLSIIRFSILMEKEDILEKQIFTMSSSCYHPVFNSWESLEGWYPFSWLLLLRALSPTLKDIAASLSWPLTLGSQSQWWGESRFLLCFFLCCRQKTVRPRSRDKILLLCYSIHSQQNQLPFPSSKPILCPSPFQFDFL